MTTSTMLLLFALLAFALGQETDHIPLTYANSCTRTQFFDITTMSCRPCATGAIQDPKDSTQCACASNYKQKVNYGGYALECEACESGQIVSPSGWECMPCAGDDPNACDKCDSTLTQFLYYSNVFGTPEFDLKCRSCSNKTIAETTYGRTFCVPCQRNTFDQDCICSTGVRAGGICFTSEDDLQALQQMPDSAEMSTISYDNGDSIDSWYMREHLRAAFVLCQRGNLTACQLIANLCALTHFRKSNTAGPCYVYERLRGGPLTPGVRWQVSMPQMYAPDSIAFLQRQRIPTSYTAEPNHKNSRIRLRLAQYALNGTYLGYVRVDGDDPLQLCRGDRVTLRKAYEFGTFYTHSCELSLSRLWDKDPHGTVLYDAYLEYEGDNSDVTELYYVYALDRQYKDAAGSTLNQERGAEGEQRSQWQLTRRFFLIDNVLGSDNPNTPARVVRYARHITLHFELQTTKNGHIFPPFLDIVYEDVPREQQNHTRTTVFQTSYSMNTERHRKDLEITMGILSSLGLLWAALRAWSWLRRTGKLMLDMPAIAKFVLYFFGSTGDVFFVVMFATALWIWGSYKLQQTFVYMLLTSDQEEGMLIVIYVALALKSVEILHHRVECMLSETFFIDWERPRGHVIPERGENAEVEPSMAMLNHQPLAPVTIWRTYMIANEWNELQKYRKTGLALQLFAVLFLLRVCNLEALALATPRSEIPPIGEQITTVIRYTSLNRFALAAALYLLCGFVQWILNVLIIERAFADHFRNFMDLCSMANISVLTLTQSHHGYYIHGRSVHGYSDANMKQMNEMLQRERDNLVGNRGLEPGTEQQCYIVCLPNSFRERFDSLRKAITAGAVNAAEGVNATTHKMNMIVQVHESVNTFLSAFIEQRIEGISYVIKDRTFVEAVLDFDFEETTQQGLFYRDPSDMAYSTAFIYGNEWINLSFDCVLFCVIDLLTWDFTLAACITFIVHRLLDAISDTGFTRNLVRSSLVDSRFLI